MTIRYFLLFIIYITSMPLGAETFYSRGIKQYKAKEYTPALKSFYVSARHYDSNSYYMLGKMHEEGIGTGSNPYTAFYWYEKSARRGHSIAQYRLGYLYETGTGVKQNLKKSKRWYSQASRNGNHNAKMRLSQKAIIPKKSQERIVTKMSSSSDILLNSLREDDD